MIEVIVGRKDKIERKVHRMLNVKGEVINEREWGRLIPKGKSMAGYIPVMIQTDYGWDIQLVKETRIEKRYAA